MEKTDSSGDDWITLSCHLVETVEKEDDARVVNAVIEQSAHLVSLDPRDAVAYSAEKPLPNRGVVSGEVGRRLQFLEFYEDWETGPARRVYRGAASISV